MRLRSTLAGSAAAIAMVLAMTAVPATASAAPSWTPPTTLGPTGRESGAPELAIAPDGEAIATWVSSGRNGIQVSTRPAGGTWSAAVTIAPVREEVEGPEIAVSAGKAVIVWTDTIRTRSGAARVILAATRLRGKRWSKPRNVSAEKRWRSEPEGEEPQVTMTRGGKAIVIWKAGDEGHSTTSFIRSATQAAAGTNWTAPVGLPGSIEGEAPQVGVTPAGESAAFWGASYDEESAIEAASRPAKGLWRGSGRLATPGSFPQPQLAIASSGEAIGAWPVSTEVSSELQVATRKPGSRWKVKSLAPGKEANAPTIVTEPGGRAKVVWVSYGANGEREVVTASHSPDGAWTTPVSLAAEGLQLPRDAYPKITVTEGGESIAVWASRTVVGEGATIQASSKAPGLPWTAPTNLEVAPPPDLSGESDPVIAVTPSGEAVAIWRSYTGTEWVVKAATRTAAGPT
jgi:hypothetical protein